MVPYGRSRLLLAFYSLLRDSAPDRQFTAGKMKRLKPPGLEVQHSLESQRSSGLRGHASKKPKVSPQPCLMQSSLWMYKGAM